MASYRRTSAWVSEELIEALDNSPAARRIQVAEIITSTEGFRFPKSGVILQDAAENAELVAALAKDGHLVSRQTAESRAVEYVKGLLMAANRMWPLVSHAGKKLFHRQLALCSFNGRGLYLPRELIELLLPALVHAREHYLVRLGAQLDTKPEQYAAVAPTDMTQAAAQYLLVRMSEVLQTRGIAFKGAPMSLAAREEVRRRAQPVGQAAQNNRRGTILCANGFVQRIMPVTRSGGGPSGMTATEWFGMIDHMGAMDGGLAGPRRG
ncbi:hypothetical protein JDV02_003297 [Purpureocillium takamizusanense]|uniref:Uncharacterized protein n=1 Tax=Purpureocillium takamizusanense TaxID=2060973 RepID=A0A9Q8V9I5_9HYPO|nr:uncharacterized protein JDV02_003297 [Purpureocillium takamizusanense]UNI16909.1 hypothetical protein JDV02_003297 [Purpureocillium takamizusanense]